MQGLAAEGIAAFRGERLVLQGIALAVPPGGALLLLGANGSGVAVALGTWPLSCESSVK